MHKRCTEQRLADSKHAGSISGQHVQSSAVIVNMIGWQSPCHLLRTHWLVEFSQPFCGGIHAVPRVEWQQQGSRAQVSEWLLESDIPSMGTWVHYLSLFPYNIIDFIGLFGRLYKIKSLA